MELDARKNMILRLAVEAFIEEAQPVSSSAVANRLPDVNLSPATIRSVMAELETEGLLSQPHTSAGRIPTERGLRVYLDQLVDTRLRPRDRQRLEVATADVDPLDFPASLGQSLAGLSGQVAVVAVPRFFGTRYCEVGLVRYDPRRFLAFFVSPAGLVQQKIVEVDFDLEPDQLTEAQNFLNEQLKEQTVDQLRALIQAELDGSQSTFDSLKRRALEIGVHTLATPTDTHDLEIYVEGASSLVGQPEFADRKRLQQLLKAIEDRRALLELMVRILDRSGVQVMLGSEHHVRSLPQVACVGDSWLAPTGRRAAVTLLGPARMNYSRLVPLVQFATQLFAKFGEI